MAASLLLLFLQVVEYCLMNLCNKMTAMMIMFASASDESLLVVVTLAVVTSAAAVVTALTLCDDIDTSGIA